MVSFSYLSSQIQQVKIGSWSIFLRKINKFLSIFWAIPCVFVMRMMNNFILIRLGTIRGDRIGHFCIDAGIHFINNKENHEDVINWYWLPKKISNKFWKKMVCRNFSIHNWTYYVDYWNKTIPGGMDHIRHSSHFDTGGSRDIFGVLSKGYQNMSFLDNEDNKARNWLKKYGWQDGCKFVCFLVRDSSYLNNDSNINFDLKVYNNNFSFDYHNYRNTDINTYIDAMEWLADNGVWVFRMGKIMAKNIESDNPRIVDYSFLPDKSDFMDIWLFANCTACISTGTGLDMLGVVYNRPMLFLNYIPLSYFISFSGVTHSPKYLVWNKNKELLTWSEYCKHGYLFGDEYDKHGIKVIDLSSDEILMTVKEFWTRLAGDRVEDINSKKDQEKFIEISKQMNDYKKIHGFIHKDTRISTTFLKNNPKWLQ
jgi:putative glycosyltransferase (TIGR04372 family)